LAGILPENLDALVTQFSACGDCQECMQVCPICEIDFPRKGEDGRYLKKDLVNWLVSCAGCGMCEQACPNHQPLNMAFSYIRQQIEPAQALAA
jgi:Pyruvate/2-oxoacid:ferredoxin oxidoreductase delta subunit